MRNARNRALHDTVLGAASLWVGAARPLSLTSRLQGRDPSRRRRPPSTSPAVSSPVASSCVPVFCCNLRACSPPHRRGSLTRSTTHSPPPPFSPVATRIPSCPAGVRCLYQVPGDHRACQNGQRHLILLEVPHPSTGSRWIGRAAYSGPPGSGPLTSRGTGPTRSCYPHPRRSRPLCRRLSGPG